MSPHYTSYPIIGDAQALGLLASAEVRTIPSTALTKLRVMDCMIPADRTLTLADRDDLADAVTALLQTELSRALVVEDRELVGLLSIADVRRLLEHREHAAGRR